MASAQDIITAALRLLGVYGATEIPETEDLNDCLVILNLMLDSWNAEHLMVYTIVNYQLSLIPGAGSYTIGPGGTFAHPRPSKIETAGLLRSGSGVRQDLKIDTSITWASIPEKIVTGKLPLRFYCDYAHPLAKFSVWPVPSQACSVDLNVWNALTLPLVIGDIFNFPPAYSQAILYNLTVAIAPHYGKDPGAVIGGLAIQNKNVIMGLNASMFAGTQDPPAPPAAA